jgi:gamma-glutamylaminecyclotransferase
MVEATTILEKIGVHSVNDLSVALHNIDNFKQLLLLSTGCITIFDEDTLAALTDLLLPAAIVGTNQLVECAANDDDDEGNILLFVYGSLLSGLHNFQLLERSSAVYMGPAGTSDEYYLCSRGPGFSFPYVTKQEVIPGQIRTKVEGEVYKVPIQHVPELDRLENHPLWYRRQQIEVLLYQQEGEPERKRNGRTTTLMKKAWIYILENQDDIDEMKSKPDVFHDVSDGDWKRFLRENSNN